MSVKQVKLVGMGPMAPENEPKVIILRTLARVVKCGRKAENDVVLTDQSISGVHCELWLQKTEAGSITAVIKDTSTNGTFVNDRRMKKGAPQELKDKDTIQLTRPKLANANDKLALSFRIEYDASDSPEPSVPLVAPSLDIMAAFEEQQEEDDDEEDNDAVFDLLD
eukprot:Platyproteum_vivax@DN6827_c0_g1_i1.p1